MHADADAGRRAGTLATRGTRFHARRRSARVNCLAGSNVSTVTRRTSSLLPKRAYNTLYKMVVLSTLRRHLYLLDEEILLLALINSRRRNRRTRRKHRWWVHPINRRRRAHGAYNNLIAELLQDEENVIAIFVLQGNNLPK